MLKSFLLYCEVYFFGLFVFMFICYAYNTIFIERPFSLFGFFKKPSFFGYLFLGILFAVFYPNNVFNWKDETVWAFIIATCCLSVIQVFGVINEIRKMMKSLKKIGETGKKIDDFMSKQDK